MFNLARSITVIAHKEQVIAYIARNTAYIAFKIKTRLLDDEFHL